MSHIYLKFNSVSFSYDSSVEQLFNDISFHLSKDGAVLSVLMVREKLHCLSWQQVILLLKRAA